MLRPVYSSDYGQRTWGSIKATVGIRGVGQIDIFDASNLY